MARTVTEIKKEITDNFIGNAYIQARYGLDNTKDFEQQFSKVSLESIVFYVVALAIQTIEKIFDAHMVAVLDKLSKLKTHSPAWYREKIMRFQFPGRDVVTDKDYYDNTGLDETDITALEVVKFCTVEDGMPMKAKVAKGTAGARIQLTNDEVTGLTTYINKIKDGGVRVDIINQQADKVFAELVVYFNPLLLDPTAKPVESAFKNYVTTLDFNGILSRNKLEDKLQAVIGVELIDLTSVLVQRAANPAQPLGVQKIAESGYFVVNDDADLVVTYKPYTYENL